MELFNIPESFTDLDEAALLAWIEEATDLSQRIAATPAEFTTDEFTLENLIEAATEGVAAVEAAKAELAGRAEAPAGPEGDDPDGDVDPDAEPEADPAAELSALADRARVAADEAAALEPETAAVEPDAPVEPAATVDADEPVEPAVEPAVVVAAARPARPARLARPGRSRSATPAAETLSRIALTAAAEGLGFGLGTELGQTEEETGLAVARMMIKRRSQFGTIAEGTHGDTIPIARAEWSDLYPAERTLTGDEIGNFERINAVTASAVIRAEFAKRLAQPDSLTASGGLCAPVTPYYGLQLLATADRPVRASLPSFNADRGGINFARPAGIGSIAGGVGYITAAEDAAGGSSATKSCQVVDCPDFEETDVAIIYHCLQFGNLGARTFPELLAQWNSLVMAAHARVAETALLDGIDDASTQVTASGIGFGASAALPSQIVAAANGMRSRNRMATDAVLRVMLPYWVLDLLVSDVYRTQFQRFDTTPEQFVALLRSHNVEPTFYQDSATGKGQVWGAQTDGALLPFPAEIVWYLFPEGSFLYLDGGTLELGLVRDSVLNATNDFQIFGETFENVAFIGIESLAVTSTTCDSGTVSAPHATTCPITY